MIHRFRFGVRGTAPAPKGSYRAMHRKDGTTYMIPSSRGEKPWREAVRRAVLEHSERPALVRIPVSVECVFYLQRPKSVSERKRPQPIVKPDIDKLQRSTLDALTDSGIISDDAIITRITATKTYVPTCTDIGMRCTLEWEQ